MRIHLVTSEHADTQRLEQTLAVFSSLTIQRGAELLMSHADWRRIHYSDLTIYAWDDAFAIGSSLWEMALRHPGLIVLSSSANVLPQMSLGMVIGDGQWKPGCHGEIFEWSGEAFDSTLRRACEVCVRLRSRLAAFAMVNSAMASASEWLPEGQVAQGWAGGVVRKIHALTNGADSR